MYVGHRLLLLLGIKPRGRNRRERKGKGSAPTQIHTFLTLPFHTDQQRHPHTSPTSPAFPCMTQDNASHLLSHKGGGGGCLDST